MIIYIIKTNFIVIIIHITGLYYNYNHYSINDYSDVKNNYTNIDDDNNNYTNIDNDENYYRIFSAPNFIKQEYLLPVVMIL
jgi:type II restriction/modification system DNA methylase subunit YeeA